MRHFDHDLHTWILHVIRSECNRGHVCCRNMGQFSGKRSRIVEILSAKDEFNRKSTMKWPEVGMSPYRSHHGPTNVFTTCSPLRQMYDIDRSTCFSPTPFGLIVLQSHLALGSFRVNFNIVVISIHHWLYNVKHVASCSATRYRSAELGAVCFSDTNPSNICMRSCIFTKRMDMSLTVIWCISASSHERLQLVKRAT